MSIEPENIVVTVTGASGFIALHCVRELLQRGYRVRGTLRSPSKQAAVRAALAPLEPGDRLSFVETDLSDDAGWDEAMAGATYALHVASPLPNHPPRDADELIRPAREGTLRALAAASKAGVVRLIMTSSSAAVMSGRDREPGRTFDENDWSDLGQPMGAYERSKTLAEQAAWEFVRGLPPERRLELVTMNPVFVLGPSLLGTDNTSNEIVRKLLRREVPGIARLQLGLVDVRDVAIAHVLAMIVPEAAGERFILCGESRWMQDIADELAAAGYKVPTRLLPNFLVRLVSLFDPTVRLIVGYLGKPYLTTSAKAQRLLGWSARPMTEMVLDTAASISKRRSN